VAELVQAYSEAAHGVSDTKVLMDNNDEAIDDKYNF